jgi:CDP-6-deoxy-D-xylo-4-hexulose-3-dehydrase
LNILEGKEIKIISDNCDSLGSRWRGKFLTDYSIAASCSFYPAHHITTMEGGMISSIDEEIVKLARSFAWWGRACYCVGVQNLLPNGTCKKRFSNWIEDCEVIVDHKYVFENIGYNLKPLDLQGAVGVVQLEKFEEIHQMRRKNKELIAHAFERINGVKVLDELTHSETSWFGVPIVCSNSHLKTKLVQFLEENKIQTRNYFAGNILQQPAYRELGNYNSFPNANRVLSEVFFVGCSPTFTDDMLNYVESTLAKFAI